MMDFISVPQLFFHLNTHPLSWFIFAAFNQSAGGRSIRRGRHWYDWRQMRMRSQEPCNSTYRNTHQEFCTCPNIAAKGLAFLGIKESIGSGCMSSARVPRSQLGNEFMVSLRLLLAFPFTVALSIPVPELIDGLFEFHNPFILPPAGSTSFVLSFTTWRPVK